MTIDTSIKRQTVLTKVSKLEAKWNLLYNNQFDYSKSHYVNSTTKFYILCKICNTTLHTTPKLHTKNKGCSVCNTNRANVNQRYTTEEFIDIAKLRRADTDYYKTVYIDTYTEITFTCKVCNIDYLQEPRAHLQSSNGCPQCGKTKKLTTDNFITRAKITHGDLYNYDSVSYINYKTPVSIVCNICTKPLLQIPADHLRGHGCKLCSTGGSVYKNDTKTKVTMYYLKLKHHNVFKIGITKHSVKFRFSSDYDLVEVIATWQFNTGAEAHLAEKTILDTHKHKKYVGEDLLKSGNTELFTEDILNLYNKE